MPFQLSPGVAVVEKDFTSIVPAVSTSAGAFAGVFQWGPVLSPVTITSENDLVRRFGKPSDETAQSFFTAANFLSYTNNLLVVRADTVNHRNAVASPSGTVTSATVTSNGSGYTSVPTVAFSLPQISGGVRATGNAVIAGSAITSAAISNGGSGYTGTPTVTFTAPTSGTGTTATGTVTTSGGAVTGITITSGGSGYTAPPTAIISGGGGTGATAVYNGEDSVSGGNSQVRYISKKVQLAPGFEAGDLRVYMDAYRPFGSGILVYYKVLAESDPSNFDDNSWILMSEAASTKNFI